MSIAKPIFQEAEAKNYEIFQKYAHAKIKAINETIVEENKQIKKLENVIKQIEGFQKKLSADIWVPLGNVAFFPGKLVNTNKYTVMLGADYFVEASAHDACAMIGRRLELLRNRVEQFQGGITNIEKEISFGNDFYNKSKDVVDIIEEYVEDTEETKRQRYLENKPQSVNQEKYLELMEYLDKMEEASDEEIDESEEEYDGEAKNNAALTTQLPQDLDSDDDMSEDETIMNNEIVDDLANYVAAHPKADVIAKYIQTLNGDKQKHVAEVNIGESNTPKPEIVEANIVEVSTKKKLRWNEEKSFEYTDNMDRKADYEKVESPTIELKSILSNKKPSPINHEAVKRMNEENKVHFQPITEEVFSHKFVEKIFIDEKLQVQDTSAVNVAPTKPVSRFKASRMNK
uniref:Unconventional prefoldin RPB5 interactor n=1 Tax=Rhabditophanes sp. KR3021 TaxID=114890 RepID=A0AC35THE5_9BILA